MKISMKYLTLMLTVCFFLANDTIFAQKGKEAHIYIVTTHKAVIPEDGSGAERDSLLMELTDVEKSNEKILSQLNLRHTYGNDSNDWVVITEYKSWADIQEADKINQELYKKKWPDEKKRQEFFSKLLKYFGGHSDEIYTELPKFGM